MSEEFEQLIEKLLEQKPELTRDEIKDLIGQKKEKIGAGYLTDQGALFLIASDLGIPLSEPKKAELALSDLYAGAKEVSLETRLLNISPTKQFSRKDGSPLSLRTMTVYDGKNSTASVKLWDEKAKSPELDHLRPGDLIKIIKAYVKSDLNGNPTINIGSGSRIEYVENNSNNIPTIDDITIDASEIKENQRNIVVSGTLSGQINSMSFTNFRGEPGKALRFMLKGKKDDSSSFRVVLWGKDESVLPKAILPQASVRLLGVRTKMGNQSLEIHGNESTILEIEGKKEVEPLTVRIISKNKTDYGNTVIIAADEKANLYNIVDTAGKTSEFDEDQVIECMPSKAHGNSITFDEGSFVRTVDQQQEQNMPTVKDIRTKISDVKAGGYYCVEAIILKIPDRREIQTKSGESISLSEMFVEDDSGQIWIKGWRNQARMIDKCSTGQIVSVTGLNARPGLEGRVELFLTPYSKITNKN